MKIRVWIQHTDNKHPYVEDIVDHVSKLLHREDLITAGFEEGSLTKVTFELENGYIITYEKVEDNA